MRGAFSLGSPVRPNPIASSIVSLVSVESDGLIVRCMDCVDGAPLLDINPHRTLFKWIAPRQPRDDEAG